MLTEYIGTFGLVFIGGFAVMQNAIGNLSLAGVAIAHALVLSIMVYFGARFSGAHYNPAVTLSFVVTKKLEPKIASFYIISQLLGSITAALLLFLFRTEEMKKLNSSTALGFPPLANGYNIFLGVLLEAILTFILVFVIWAVAVDKKAPNQIFGLAIGGTIGFNILAAGPITGAAMNPARVFGPTLVALEFSFLWIYWVGPILGGICAGLVYNSVFLRLKAKEATD